ncbi:hypothetical protein VIGAN_03263800 [Vigna angularis var. angularis]|uniref:NADH dehydrogenase [ubiquinone] 1 beta subcomplex subunit 3-B n=1 Tax=Vigna angularis var. angularis TaxID=157739 RepID=A0A0S3RPR3_PHAAN|nr:NADH dehydrogenase [ubiquinone] 1 beta subcomplex subunit 3-B-like [Vigna angularis]BAT82598.1 hypothetical protein VIGAN_03263800 [Vigna angularis var. angularis]
MQRKERKWRERECERIEIEEEMGSGKHTAEFFRRRDAWRKHPMLTNQFRHATPGLGIALVAFGFYLVGEQVYDRLNADSHAHVKAENHH